MRRAPVTLQQAAQPSFTLIEERIAGTTATDVPQGGSAQFYVVLQSNNGYTGTPALSATDLPPGISVTFSNNALETYGVVTATVSANYQAAPVLTTANINGFDGTTWYTLGAQFTVTTPPLTASASLMFSHANSTTHTAQLATIRAATSGGAAPFTYT